jgi:hypothetical protein
MSQYRKAKVGLHLPKTKKQNPTNGVLLFVGFVVV